MSTADDFPEHRSGRFLVMALVLIAALTISYFLLGMPGMNHSSSAEDGSTEMDMSTMTPSFISLSPAQFDQRSKVEGAFVVNVHTPYEGELPGTNAFIPFDQITNDTRLPPAKDTPIVLYCRSGRMSKIAAEALGAAGYHNIVDLDGGMLAWVSAGRSIVNSSASSQPAS